MADNISNGSENEEVVDCMILSLNHDKDILKFLKKSIEWFKNYSLVC